MPEQVSAAVDTSGSPNEGLPAEACKHNRSSQPTVGGRAACKTALPTAGCMATSGVGLPTAGGRSHSGSGQPTVRGDATIKMVQLTV